jgi:hypothetical protein
MALALSTESIEEARTAAMAAVKLIDKHKLIERAPRRVEFAPERYGPGPVVDWARAWADIMRDPPAPKCPEWDHREHRRPEMPANYKLTTVPIGKAKCMHCAEPIPKGERAVLWSGHGFSHEACWPLAEKGAAL